MTESEWLNCEDPLVQLAFVSTALTDRKRRMFLCACCARVLEGTPTHRQLFRGYYPGSFEKLKHALGILEQFSEGLVNAGTLAEAHREAADSVYVPASIDYGGESGLDYEAATVVAAAVEHPVAGDVIRACWRATESQSAPSEQGNRCTNEARWQSMILRDIFGNPFRPVAFDSAWRTSTAVAIAKGMYESRDFSAMPILADALQDAGCDNTDILNHCRDENAVGEQGTKAPRTPHVRGCWVVDLVLGKS